MPKKLIKLILQIFALTFVIITLVFFISLILIYPWNPEQVVFIEKPEKTDLIVVLDGEYYVRVDYAFELIDLGYSDMLYYPSLRYNQTRERIAERLIYFGEMLTFYEGKGAESTYEEALLTKEFAAENSINSIILVTSPYHSYRAHWIFSKVIPEAEIISTPVPFEDNWFNLEIIEESEEAKEIIKSEQIKFFAYYLLYGWRIY